MKIDNVLLRRVVAAGQGDNTETGGSKTPDAQQQTNQSDPGQSPPAGDKGNTDDGEDEDPQARGSKTQVLADLARERDKRQAVEAQLAEAQKRLDEIDRANMTA